MTASPAHRPGDPAIAPATRMGPVHLTVADLDRSLAYWGRAVGLATRERAERTAALGAGGEDLVVLHEEPGARPLRGHTGLFHLALLVPSRRDLARWLRHAARERVRIAGVADHIVSEAIYLTDPDGHGIEIYRDRPRERWRWVDGRLEMDTLPLHLDDLAAAAAEPEGAPFAGLAPGTTMGHVHLHVRDVAEAEGFYRDVLGFDVTASLWGSATFLSAGGYHHHLAGNVWAGRGAPPPPPGSAALRHATIVLPDAAEVDRVAGRVADAGRELVATPDGVLVRDPSRNALLLAAG